MTTTKALRIVARSRSTISPENLKALSELERLPPDFQRAVRNVIYCAAGVPIPSKAKNVDKPVITIGDDDRPGA